MTTTSGIRQVDLAGAPAIPGLRSRYFADASDYEALAVLFGAANQADQVPWFPTAAQRRARDGRWRRGGPGQRHRPGRGRWPARGRHGRRAHGPRRRPDLRHLGRGRPGVSTPRPWHRAPGLDDGPRSCPGIARGSAHGRPRAELQRGHGDRPSRAPRGGRVRDGPPLLPDAPDRARRCPGRRPARGPRDPPGRRGPVAHDLRRRERGVPRSLGPSRDDRRDFRSDLQAGGARHRPVGRRLGRRPGRRRRPDLGLAGGERATRGQARLARAHQRPTAVAPARTRPGDHGGLARQAPRARPGGGDARGRLGEPERGARPVRRTRLRRLQPRDGLRASARPASAWSRPGRPARRPARRRSTGPSRRPSRRR